MLYGIPRLVAFASAADSMCFASSSVKLLYVRGISSSSQCDLRPTYLIGRLVDDVLLCPRLLTDRAVSRRSSTLISMRTTPRTVTTLTESKEPCRVHVRIGRSCEHDVESVLAVLLSACPRQGSDIRRSCL